MSVFFIILPLAIVMAAIAFTAFLLAVKSGQFDDLETPPHRITFHDE